MRNKKINKINVILIILFVSNILCFNVSSEPIKTIYGSLSSCGNTSFQGAIVVVSSEGFPDEEAIVNSENSWQVDVGSETGIEWPQGTVFNVSITFNSWTGSLNGSVTGTYTNIGDIQMIPSDFSINAYVINNSMLTNFDINFQSTVTGGDPPYNFTWYIDDENIIHNQNITYQFKQKGEYNIKLIIRDSCGNEKQDSLSFIIEENQNTTHTPGFEITLLLYILGFFIVYNKWKKK
jgi:hypothetical protein